MIEKKGSLLVGLTGGIGAGKSTVREMFAELGAATISTDDLAREVTVPGGPGLIGIREAFGASFIKSDGTLDRPALAKLVFAAPEARKKLEAILHPLIIDREEELIRRWEQAGRKTPLIVEAALLFQIGRQSRFDGVVLVTCPKEIRLTRLDSAGVCRSEAEKRMKAQWPEERCRPLADHIIDNGGTLEETLRQVRNLFPLLQKSPGGVR